MFADYVDQHKDISTPLINVRARNLTWESGDTQIDDLRASEKELISLGQDEHYLAMFDLRYATRMTAGLSIVRTLFVCAVLAFGSLHFSKDAHEIVILPIEQMIRKVNSISTNPIEAAQDEAAQAIEDEILGKKKEDQEGTGSDAGDQSLSGKCKSAGHMVAKCATCGSQNQNKVSSRDGPYETVILEQTIVKIGALLAQGFGEAGTKIIADNMAKTQGNVDPMIPGNKVVAIFGFCDIRSF